MQAFKCDFCSQLFEEEKGVSTKSVLFNHKSLEVHIEIRDQQSNTQYDVCENCFKEIIKLSGEN